MASKTRRLGASKVRDIWISVSDGVVTLNESLLAAARLASMTLLPGCSVLVGFHGFQITVEAIEPALPQVPVRVRPPGDFLERRGVDPAMPPLGVVAADDESGVLQHAEVFRHRR